MAWPTKRENATRIYCRECNTERSVGITPLDECSRCGWIAVRVDVAVSAPDSEADDVESEEGWQDLREAQEEAR